MKNEDSKEYLNQLLDRGLHYLNNNVPKKALEKFNKILEHRPSHANILNLVSLAFNQMKDYKKALHYINKAIENNSNEVGFYINLGNIHKELKNYKEAEESYLVGLKLDNKSAILLYNIALLYASQHNYPKAVTYYERSIKIDASNKFTLDNLASAYKELGEFDKAIKLYQEALKIDRNFSQAHFNLSLVLLLKKPSAQAWEKYEYRLKKNIEQIDKIKDVPEWDGSNLKSKSLLIICEQGIGDSVQFIRYVKKIKKDNTKIFLLIKKNLNFLFQKIDGIDKILVSENSIPTIDYYVPLMSLPFIFRQNLNVPDAFNFIVLDKKIDKYWKEKLNNNKTKIGIVWQGAPDHNRSDFKRSIPLSLLKPILEIKEIEFVSLQKDFGREQIKSNNFENLITDYYNKIDKKPFEDTVSIINSLDMVICVCTSIAHISATMKKNTWIIIPYVPDFRWGLKNSTTSWYKNVKLFRQKRINDWAEVIEEIKQALIKKYIN